MRACAANEYVRILPVGDRIKPVPSHFATHTFQTARPFHRAPAKPRTEAGILVNVAAFNRFASAPQFAFAFPGRPLDGVPLPNRSLRCMGLLIFYILMAIGVSFLCSIMEAVLLSATSSYVAAKERKNATAGRLLKELKDDIDRPLAAILSLNTIAHTVGAAGAGAQAEQVFNSVSVGVISAVLTLLILVFSEIIPKTVGAVYWRQLAPAVATILKPVIWLLYPFVLLSQGITHLLERGEQEASVSREELRAMAHLGEEEGVFEEKESRVLKGLFRFGSLRVKDIMTPRIVMEAINQDKTIEEVVGDHDDFRFSRIPVFGKNRDDMTGYVLKDEILLKAAQEEAGTTMAEMKREMLVVQEKMPLPELFEHLLDDLEHIALVVDEYGGVAGIVTMEDVVETLLGMEIVDEDDSVEDMQVMARKQWLKRAKRLGLVDEETLESATEAEREAITQLGLTGGQPPHDGENGTEESSSEQEKDKQQQGEGENAREEQNRAAQEVREERDRKAAVEVSTTPEREQREE